MRANQRTIRGDLAAAGLLPDGDHTVVGPGGSSLPATTSLQHERRKRRLDPVSRDALYAGGWHVVSIKGGEQEGGVTSHRGVTHPDEYVDEDVLRAAIEAELGFTYDEVRSVYDRKVGGGPLPKTLRQLRARLDARLLALSRSGTNFDELGRRLDVPARTLDRALERARAAELSPTNEGSST